MKFIADGNFPGLAIKVLREAEFDFAWVSEIDRGANDDKVLARCVDEGCTLLTFDTDFGELAFKRRLPAQCGIILFRLVPQDPEAVVPIVLAAIRSRPSWSGCFAVVTRHRVRIRSLPADPREN